MANSLYYGKLRTLGTKGFDNEYGFKAVAEMLNDLANGKAKISNFADRVIIGNEHFFVMIMNDGTLEVGEGAA